MLLGDAAAFASQANVFVYHRFDDSRYPSTNISGQDFRKHLDLLKTLDFTVLTLGQIVRVLQEGGTLPERCAAISIDDAYRSFLTDGWPLLKEYDYPATLFVSTDTVGGGDFLSWEELRQLQEEGVELGNHSATHNYLLDNSGNPDWGKEVRDDLLRSQQAFKVNLGSTPQLFAYPYGEFSSELIEIVRQAGFVAAFGQQSGVVSAGQQMFALPRFPMGTGFVGINEFRSKLLMKHLPVQVLSPKDPVIKKENPPTLKLYLSNDMVAVSTLKCYVPGQNKCQITLVDEAAQLYEVKAEKPLIGRRSKYTVTASDSMGKNWYWFSHLWVMPR